ncbi:MAG TPA: hypothetical protein VN817_12540, partial [Solirubrobacteraceae bacterium]|nr:hypothetical protein [Solirubrobacteraceae bacterium]
MTLCLCLAACGALPSAAALGHGFAAPVLLPAGNSAEWHFALNDRGEGGAVRGTATGAVFYPFEPSGSIGSPIELTVPGGFASSSQAIAINAQGMIAVALLYKDATTKPSDVEHGGAGCCGRVALTSWRYGQSPPPVQVLSPQRSSHAGGEVQVLTAPSLVVGPAAISAIWTREESNELEAREYGPEGKAELVEAYGRFGEPLHVEQLTTAPRGVQIRRLGLAASGSPFASWLEDRDKLVGIDGRSNGALSGRRRTVRIAHLSVPKGFATESGPSQRALFSYFSDSHNHRLSVLNTIARRPGRPFGPVHRVATIAGAGLATLADATKTTLSIWSRSFGPLGEDHLYAQRSEGSRAAAPESLGRGENPTSFIDGHGRSVIVYRRPVAHEREAYELVAATAEEGHPFGAPQPIAPALRRCGAEHEEEFNRQPLAL